MVYYSKLTVTRYAMMRRYDEPEKRIMKPCDPEEFHQILDGLMDDARVREMKRFTQHGSISTFDHCRNVATLSQRLNRRLRLKADEETLLKGAMLHDYFLYDWHKNYFDSNGWHGFSHASVATQNAREDFDVDPQIEHIIQSHMWPLNITRIPRSREAWIVCFADKIVSGWETLQLRRKKQAAAK